MIDRACEARPVFSAAACPSFFSFLQEFMRNSKVQSLLLVVCFLLVPLGASADTAPDAERLWTTVGSAGTLDEKSVVQKGHTGVISQARLQPRTEGGIEETDSAVIRYNVTAVDGLFVYYRRSISCARRTTSRQHSPPARSCRRARPESRSSSSSPRPAAADAGGRAIESAAPFFGVASVGDATLMDVER